MPRIAALLLSTSIFLAALGLAAAEAQQAQVARPRPQEQQVLRPRPQLQAQRPQQTQQPQDAGAIFTVPANAGWTPTGVPVREGDTITMQVLRNGRWSVLGGGDSPNNNASAALERVGTDANGREGSANQPVPRTDYRSLMPTANWGALIGRIDEGAPFLVGTSRTLVAPADGVLQLSNNDAPTQFYDNLNGLIVQITVTPRPETAPPPAAPPTPEGQPPSPDADQRPPDAASPTPPPGKQPPNAGAPPSPPAPPPPPWLAPAIGAAAVLGLLLALFLSFAGGRGGARSAAAGAAVTTRFVNDGRATQTLTINVRGKS